MANRSVDVVYECRPDYSCIEVRGNGIRAQRRSFGRNT
jgi:hypothetical protein